MIQRDMEYDGDSGGYVDRTTNTNPEEPKKLMKYNKWFEIWFIVILMIVASIIAFNNDPGFSGYCLGGAIMLPLLIWYFDN